eukprot:8510797-Karenia_brevis.AAC.1
MPTHLAQSLGPGPVHITLGESLALLLAFYTFGLLFANGNLLWFVDNQAAAAAFIKGASPANWHAVQ